MQRYYPYYVYQQGGERNLPVPAPQGAIPMLPVVTNPRDFARLYGQYNGMGSDAGVPDRVATTAAYLQQEQARQEAARRMVEERKKRSRVSHTPVGRLSNPSVSDMGMRDPGLSAGDLADQNGVLLPSELRSQLAQGLNENQQLRNRLMRLGYSEQQAAALGRQGRSQLHPSLQQQLEDQELTDYRVMHHPDYDPHVPVEEQQGLSDDTSLRARVLRGKNMLLNSGNPLGDFVTRMATGPGQSFANLTMDAENQYVKPGLARGALNFGHDVMNLLPGFQEQATNYIVNRASPQALSYMVNPVVQGAEDFGKWYIPRAASSERLPGLFPRHSAFTKDVDELMQHGIPLKDAVRTAYRPIKGDNLEGMALVKHETPREVFAAVAGAQENLPGGRQWLNPSYSHDSYPLMLDYISKRMDAKKYDIIPTYRHTGLNTYGYKSSDLLEALPEAERSSYMAKMGPLNDLIKKHRDLKMQVAKAKDKGVKDNLEKILSKNLDETNVLMNDFQQNLSNIFKKNPEVAERLKTGYNNRIQAINQRFGSKVPLAQNVELPIVEGDDAAFADSFINSKELMVPQFFIYRKPTNPFSGVFNFADRIGLSPLAGVQNGNRILLSKLSKLARFPQRTNNQATSWDVGWD